MIAGCGVAVFQGEESAWSQCGSGFCRGCQWEGGVLREPGVWGVAGEVLCCASGLGKHWDGWESSSRDVAVMCGRRALEMWWLEAVAVLSLQKDGKCDVVLCGVRRVGSMGSSPGCWSLVGEI